MRIFFASTAAVLTDRHGHGESLIALDVLRGLAARGHTIVACAPTVDLSETPPFTVLELGRPRNESLQPFVYASRARRALAAHGPADVVHWLYPGEPDQALFVPPSGTPFVVGPLFSAWPNGQSRGLRLGDLVRTALRPVERRLGDRAVAAATVLLATRGARPKGRLLPPGVDLARFDVEPARGATVAFIGRLERSKGVRELVEAFAAVRRRHPDARLVMAGDGSERGWLEQQEVELLGHVPADGIPALLRSAALAVVPSYGEPFGMTVLEAMAAGRAVVATDAGGPHHLVVPGTGRLVPVGDVGALADAIASLLDAPDELAATGLAAREHVERNYSLDAMLDALEQVYCEVAA